MIVHGGGPDITSYMERLGMEVRFVEGVRVSDPETVEVAKMVLLGKVNSDIVSRLNRHGQPAVGLSGEDGTLFEIRPHPDAERVGFVGDVERVDVDVLNHIAEDYIPVVASAGTDREGNSYNVNADTAAGKVAAALRAYKAIFLTDIAGWLADPADPGSLVSRAEVDEVASALERRGRRHAARSWAPAWRRSAAGSPRPTSSTARSRIRCCSSCSPTPASGPWCPLNNSADSSLPHRIRCPRLRLGHFACAPDSGDGGFHHEPCGAASARGAVRDAHVCAGAGGVRAGGGRAAVGRRTAGSTWTSSPGSRFTTPATATRGSWPRSASRRSALAGVSNLYYTEPAMRLCERLAESSLGGKVFLCNSGAEANECAIKLVRKHAHRRGIAVPEIVVLDGAFHGRTLGTLAATPRLARDDLFGPLPAGYVAVPRDDPERFARRSASEPPRSWSSRSRARRGSSRSATTSWSRRARPATSRAPLLVFDEIQTGMGRTGSLWAYQQLPVRPDVITAAKALGGGLPVGACVTAPELGDVLERGDHGSTFAGGADRRAPRRSAAIEVIDDPELLRRTRELGARFMRGAGGPGRGRRGPRARADGRRHPADGVDAAAVAGRALDDGLVINVPGPGMLRFLPPLTIGSDQVDAATAIMARVLG